jgi:dihydroneopterin aldolase
MDIELSNLINYIQSIKQDLYKKHKLQLIDGKSAILNQQPIPNSNDETQTKAYQRIMQQQRKILYRNNFEAQDSAANRVAASVLNTQDIKEAQDSTKPQRIKLSLKSKDPNITVKSSTTQSISDFCKSWTKLPSNLKIQAILKFIDSLTPCLTDDQKNQLRFLLVSSISNKKLVKQTDVEYDVNQGCITRIVKLSYDGSSFSLIEDGAVSFPFNVGLVRKKLVLLKK